MNTIYAESAVTSAPAARRTALKEAVTIPINGVAFPAELVVPSGATGLVLFIVANGCILETPRAALIARAIRARGLATLSFFLLTEAEAHVHSGDWGFDIDVLTCRILRATGWALRHPPTRDLGVGYFATSTYASAALAAAAQLGYAVEAVVSRSGRPDLAGDLLRSVTAPTLLIVGERDEAVLEVNRRSLAHLMTEKRLSVVAGAGNLFDDPGTLEQVGELAADWFCTHLKPTKRN